MKKTRLKTTQYISYEQANKSKLSSSSKVDLNSNSQKLRLQCTAMARLEGGMAISTEVWTVRAPKPKRRKQSFRRKGLIVTYFLLCTSTRVRDRGGSEDEIRLRNSKPRLFKFTLPMDLNLTRVMGDGWWVQHTTPQTNLKSINVQYNTLGCLDDGTNESSTKCLMFFMISCKILYKTPFNLFSYSFYKIT